MGMPGTVNEQTRCSVCGEHFAPNARFCRICLEPRIPRHLLPRNTRLACILLPLAFVGTCFALLPLGSNLADPITNASLESAPDMRFPVLVMTGETARVQLLQDLRRIPKLPTGSSYLVPRGREKAVQAAINANRSAGIEGGWVLRVRPMTPERQRIELFWMNDGYRGLVYEATRTTISPR